MRRCSRSRAGRALRLRCARARSRRRARARRRPTMHVVGLEVAVHEPGGVGGREPAAGLRGTSRGSRASRGLAPAPARAACVRRRAPSRRRRSPSCVADLVHLRRRSDGTAARRSPAPRAADASGRRSAGAIAAQQLDRDDAAELRRRPPRTPRPCRRDRASRRCGSGRVARDPRRRSCAHACERARAEPRARCRR